MSAGAVVICGAREFLCECVEPAGHWPGSPHRCDPGCGGSWTFDEHGRFVVVTLPFGTPTGRPRSDSGPPQPVDLPFLLFGIPSSVIAEHSRRVEGRLLRELREPEAP